MIKVGRNPIMSKKGTYSHVNHFFDHPELVQKFRQQRKNYDFPVISMKDILNKWFILDTYVPNVKTKKGYERVLLVIRELSDTSDPESTPTGKRFKIFSSSSQINTFLRGLRDSGDDVKYLPMTFKIVPEFFKDKNGKDAYRYTLFTDF